ncbi:MAG: SPFH domain-containing protein [Bryobacteraceae bacterium]
MVLLKTLLTIGGLGLFGAALTLIVIDLYRRWRPSVPEEEPSPLRIPLAGRLAGLAMLPLLLANSIAVVPGGTAGVVVSQLSGVLPDTLYPGIHSVVPFVESVVLYDARDRVYPKPAPAGKKQESLDVHTREGLTVGLTVGVRYRIDPKRLAFIYSNLPQSLDDDVVAPVVAAVFRETAPAYFTRELYAVKRDEIRRKCSEAIIKRLAGDGIMVKEVLLRDLVLPKEYAKGLEGLLLKEQENERLNFDVEIKTKLVKTAELEAEAEKMREIKRAEAEAQTTVLRAKAQADAMQHTLPLKEKQIEQTRLEAEARKESTVKNAEAMAEAKVIDSKAELERGKMMADAEANRIRVVASADAERMKTEAFALKDSPLLIQKIIAERLSDKLQIMMVPSDGKFFFTNDVFKSAAITAQAAGSGQARP